MDSEDVLERAEFHRLLCDASGRIDTAEVIYALAAEVRALVEKRERQIVWMARHDVRLRHYRDKHRLAYFDDALNGTATVEYDGTDAGLLAAIDEATGEK